MARDGISAEQVQLRMRNQISDEQRWHVANMGDRKQWKGTSSYPTGARVA
ncbi:MAG: hypothetical protein IPP33_11715 [Flavobacteriales bacterium]|nr:hypothetical protein [Flavobacteriales bacterium]